ncbi:hypothetical protein G6F62_013065 [Rhizopus arrhizus]|nr:hypothetical protein G6F23_013218 [Rhizopus arrhizus]KAG1317141.1 hypothetical protein G6F62_013065 [Rhizopus arrhizus]
MLYEVITAGQPYTITWTVTDTNAKTINSIALRSGSSNNLQISIANILSGPINVNPPQYTWNVPTTVEVGSAYALALTGDNGQTTYSTYFTILGGAAPGTSNNTASSASSATSAASHSGSAVPASSSGSASSTASASQSTSAASSLKAGMVGVAGVAGVVALFL